ncbi:hypothetical protein C8T65DRAFT_599976 [Cerioporus squamosus]|nr:hypothetical protein C8T65DRAFT_599976 [Cerioporus squamosus]
MLAEHSTPEQQQLAEQIASTEDTLVHLKTRYNAHTPIGRLPPEILSEIFLTQAARLRDERLCGISSDPYALVHPSFYTWMNVSQVCHHWRTVALGCVKLWTWLAVEPRVPEGFYQVLLQRARDSVPITVVFAIFDPGSYCGGCLSSERFHVHYDSALELLRTVLPRMRELLVYIDWEEHDEIWDNLDVSNNVLEVLRVEAVGGSRVTEMRGPYVVLPTELFASHTPRLHSLAISGIGFHWPNTLFAHSLRHLEITKCEFDDGNDDLCRLLHLIHPLTLLETLTITWWRITQSVLHEAYDVVTLPHLQQLTIAAECQRVATFLMHLRVPPTALLHISIPDIVDSGSKEHLRRAFGSIFEGKTIHHISYALGVPIQRSRDPKAAICHVWAVEGKDAVGGSSNDRWTSNNMPPPRLTLECLSESGLEQPVVTALQALDLTKLRQLRVNGLTTGRAWASALQNADSLEALRITGQCAFAIPSLLAEGRHVLDSVQIALEIRAGLDEWHWARYSLASEDTLDLREEYGISVEMLRMINHGADSGHNEGSNSATHLLFPRLRILQVIDVDFMLPNGSKDKGLQGYRHASPVDILRFRANRTKYGFDVATLAKCLRLRRTQGAPDLVRVEFEGCHCANFKEQLMPLVGLVAEVRWDGQRVPEL